MTQKCLFKGAEPRLFDFQSSAVLPHQPVFYTTREGGNWASQVETHKSLGQKGPTFGCLAGLVRRAWDF